MVSFDNSNNKNIKMNWILKTTMSLHIKIISITLEYYSSFGIHDEFQNSIPFLLSRS